MRRAMVARLTARPARTTVKRAVDMAAAAAGLLLLAPLMAVIALAILVTMGRPVLFRQARPGLCERPFTIVKFRTMRRPRRGEDAAATDAVRLTALGARLRRHSLDELPELWNVLRGDMSLVGPRPLLASYQPFFTERERVRFTVRPGITGWAQVRGRNHARWDQRLVDDVWYVEHWGLWLDLRILILTARQVVRATDVVPDARSVMRNLDEERAGPGESATAGTRPP